MSNELPGLGNEPPENPEEPDLSEKTFWVASGFGFHSHKPFVNITWPDGSAHQFSVEQARSFAIDILEAAEASVSDAFLWHLIMDKLDMDTQIAAAIIYEARQWRKEQEP